MGGYQMSALAKGTVHRKRLRGFTLVEAMIAMGLGTMVLAATAMLTLYGARTSVAVVNYEDLDSKSRYALDIISREIRQANAVLSYQTNLPVTSFTLTNYAQAAAITLSWDSTAGTVTMAKTGQNTITNLTQCDQWNFGFYQRTPLVTGTNVLFYPATNSAGNLDLSVCKLISMSWKCSRGILGAKINTESVQTAEIVMRNKQ
jgi:pilin/secretion family protein with methylation motif